MIYTVGHSTHTIDAFMELLRQHGVRQIADVRRVPASARHPQFGRHRLCRSLLESGVDYRHFAALGGLRGPQADSVNAGLRNASYRGYADHMLTPEFDEALIQLIDYARRAPTAAMCAELRYSDCHRQLLCDALLVRDVQVRHIRPGELPEPHALTGFARLEAGKVTYRGLL